MTTTLIYEPIASISDDYFRWPEASGAESSRDNSERSGPCPNPKTGAEHY